MTGDYDVFLNFRGPDSRDTIIDVLYNALSDAGIRVFLDNEGIRKGEEIKGELESVITNSRIYILIFSKDYASSRWCLRELAKIMECQKSSNNETKKVVLPVFYDVDVSEDLKLRSNVYLTALQKHKAQLKKEEVESWETALKEAAKIKGWTLKDHGLTKLADLIKKEVFNILIASEIVPDALDHLVGIHDRMEAIMQLLEEGSLDVRFIVIHGMGGIGKTTLANSIFKKISYHFQGSCILPDIRQALSVHDIVKLQEKLLSSTLNLKSIEVSDIDNGCNMISTRLRNQKVLIVLDDVDKRDHLIKLAAKSDWFGLKSRIIITTRNIDFLPTKDSKEYCFYEMKEMDRGHALQLFCRHAFENDSPPPEHYDISTKIVDTTGGLPLAIQVIGSSLYNQDDEIWKFRLGKLKEAPHKDVQQTLMISYEALEYEQQQIFLDIACLFNNKEKTDPIYFWEACRFYPTSVIKILVRRSLIKVNHQDKLWMHDQLRDLGRAIAQGLKSHIPTKPNRLWSSEVALGAIRQKEIDESVVALELGNLDANCSFVREEFARSINLKFLQLQGGNFEGDFENIFQQLRWLSWSNCPLKIEATKLSFKNLVVLTLSESEITEDWNGWGSIKVAKQLKVLNLSRCNCLTKTPDFSAFLGLERLILNDCQELKEVDQSITMLKRLDYLQISDGFFREYSQDISQQRQLLSDSIGSLKSLTVLKIRWVRPIDLHPSIGELANLKQLHLQCPKLEILPSTIGKLTSLVELNVSYSRVKELPDSIENLTRLKILRMDCCPILYIPDSIGRLESLNELHLMHTRIVMLPETIGNLRSLKVINLENSKIEKIPKAIGNLENLEELYAESFHGNVDFELHEEIGKLSHLKILKLNFAKINKVPLTISQLSHLQTLQLSGLYELQESVEFPTSLTSLSLSFSSLTGRTCNESIRTLQPTVQTPKMKWLVRLVKLEKLRLHFAHHILPSIDLSSFSRLQTLDVTCSNPQSLTHLPSNIETLILHGVKSPSEWQLFSTLNNLSTLVLWGCCYREIEFDGLGNLKDLQLRTLVLRDCEFVKKVSNLSCLKELRNLSISGCSSLVDIQGLGEVASLQHLSIDLCNSIRRLPDLSNMKKLERVEFFGCSSLESIPNIDEEIPCWLTVVACEHIGRLDGSYRELVPNRRKSRKINDGGEE